jgi:hypothetical protein
MNDSKQFISNIKNTLDDEKLDPSTKQQLSQSRCSALDGQKTKPVMLERFFKPALVFASVGLVAITITFTMTTKQTNTSTDDVFESMEILTSRDELEMYQNLEFYLWLDDQIKT